MSEVESSLGGVFLLLKKVLILLPFIIVIPFVNYQGKLIEKRGAEQLIQGQPLLDVSFIDQLLLNKYLIELFPSSRQVVVFGSSRSRQITLTSYLKKYTSFFNNAINTAGLGEFMELYNCYRKKGWSLRLLFWSVLHGG